MSDTLMEPPLRSLSVSSLPVFLSVPELTTSWKVRVSSLNFTSGWWILTPLISTLKVTTLSDGSTPVEQNRLLVYADANGGEGEDLHACVFPFPRVPIG